MREPIHQYKHIQRLRSGTNAMCKRAGVAPLPIRIAASQEPQAPHDLILRRENGGITGLINPGWRGYRQAIYCERVAPYAYWFSQTPDTVRQITADMSDGNKLSSAQYRFAITSDLYTALPDSHFFRDRGYAKTDKFAESQALDWEARSDDIIWRGAPNGTGVFSLDPKLIDNPSTAQRIRMALKCKALGVDFRFLYDPTQPFCNILRTAELTGAPIDRHQWGSMKYAVDIDGYSNAWCNFMQRLKLGCCVLKVNSPGGFYQWYYHKLKPWEHYVPIKADLSDLGDQIDWVRSYPNKAKEIAADGQALAKTLTFESESAEAARLITERET
ncbi:glycosyl transferase family 90 [Yoonia sp. BS5-3]|uniref:Glycosyl transferase family 90 n=1 Tax=Yoonia phaeophyticola TaxID=3137369 RepID=A0ABZ2V4Y1_9RHOB